MLVHGRADQILRDSSCDCWAEVATIAVTVLLALIR
jgi:hypothetical protein